MILTRQQAIAEHRKMWRWIAEEIERVRYCFDIWEWKEIYLSKKEYEILPRSNCFLCEYDSQFDDGYCGKCPVKHTGKDPCECLGGLYYKVCRAETWQEQAALARQIAELPEREKV